MIISNITGGLGNQMYQYAFGRYLAVKNNCKLKLHFTNALFNTQYAFGLDVFNIKADIASKEDLRRMYVANNRVVNRVLYLLDQKLKFRYTSHIVTQENSYTFEPKYLDIGNSTYIQGYWADERYFMGIEDSLIKEFTPKEKLDQKNQKILNQIKKTNSVSIHVRRGDLITNKRNASFIGLDYYANAIKNIQKQVKNPKYFVFSDDIPWCKQNLTAYLDQPCFVEHNFGVNSYKDLLLMSACKSNIIANSTFSVWAAWLSKNNNK